MDNEHRPDVRRLHHRSGETMVMNSRQRATLAALCPSVRWEVSMASHSTFRAGGVVEAMVEPVDSTQLAALLRWLH
ncbi:MAG: hypothetical protein KBG53_04815, partial [Desulfobulbus sp.]|nr:hypothetical protein [Desulfobulbus sp.]